MKTTKTKITVFAIIISSIAVLIGAFILRPEGTFNRLSGGLDAVAGSEYVTAEVIEITCLFKSHTFF